MSVNDKMTAIADNIRSKTSGTEPLTLDDMASGVNDVYDIGFTAGEQAEHDNFWDTYQSKGTRTNYSYMCGGRGWTDTTFKPKYPIYPTTAANMFAGSGVIDLIKKRDEEGVVLDFSKATSFQYAFGYAKLTTIGVVDTRSCSALSMSFIGCEMTTLEKLIVKQSTTYSTVFNNCTKLTNLNVEGTIGQNGFNVQWSTLLTHDSLMSIINALADYSEDTSGTTWKISIGSDNLAKLTTEEIKIAEQKGWTVA